MCCSVMKDDKLNEGYLLVIIILMVIIDISETCLSNSRFQENETNSGTNIFE